MEQLGRTCAPVTRPVLVVGAGAAGLAAARLAVTKDPFAAAAEAVWLHGEAARRAGPGFLADDLLPALPHALNACLKDRS